MKIEEKLKRLNLRSRMLNCWKDIVRVPVETDEKQGSLNALLHRQMRGCPVRWEVRDNMDNLLYRGQDESRAIEVYLMTR